MRLLSIHLKAKREARGLSQDQAAALLGVDKETLSRWERGRNKPTGFALLEKIKSEYDVSQQEVDRWFLDWHTHEADRETKYRISGYEFLKESGIDEYQLLERLIEIDTIVLPDVLQQDEGSVEQWAPLFHASPFTWKLISLKSEIIGYWHYICLKDEYFQRVKLGSLRDAEITLEMLDFPSYLDGEKTYKMYIVMVAIHSAHQNIATGAKLIGSFLKEIEQSTKNGFIFSEVAAVACTPQGVTLCLDFGMKRIGTHTFMGKNQIAEVFHMEGSAICRSGPLSKNPIITSIYRKKF